MTREQANDRFNLLRGDLLMLWLEIDYDEDVEYEVEELYKIMERIEKDYFR